MAGRIKLSKAEKKDFPFSPLFDILLKIVRFFAGGSRKSKSGITQVGGIIRWKS
jgi:hypothetical protein